MLRNKFRSAVPQLAAKSMPDHNSGQKIDKILKFLKIDPDENRVAKDINIVNMEIEQIKPDEDKTAQQGFLGTSPG